MLSQWSLWSLCLGNKLESSVGRSTDSHRRRFSLDPRQRDQKCLVSLGWLLSKCDGYGGFRVVLQVSSERTQPVLDMERDDAIRHTAPSEKIKQDQRNKEHFRVATFSASSAWNGPRLLLHACIYLFTWLLKSSLNNTFAQAQHYFTQLF